MSVYMSCFFHGVTFRRRYVSTVRTLHHKSVWTLKASPKTRRSLLRTPQVQSWVGTVDAFFGASDGSLSMSKPHQDLNRLKHYSFVMFSPRCCHLPSLFLVILVQLAGVQQELSDNMLPKQKQTYQVISHKKQTIHSAEVIEVLVVLVVVQWKEQAPGVCGPDLQCFEQDAHLRRPGDGDRTKICWKIWEKKGKW